MNVQRTTIVFPVRDNEVLLGMKKRGFGMGKWNGFGGKLDPGESFRDSAIRETREEVEIAIRDLQLVARLLFFFDDQLGVASMAYVSRNFSGEPEEKDEMRPEWFMINEIPYENMWSADKRWVPQALQAAPTDPLQELSVHFDAEGNFRSIGPADPQLLDQYLPLEQ